jgi:DNA-binding NarL/FixJ family response regulator
VRTKVAIVEDNAGICAQLAQIIDAPTDLSCVCVCRNANTAIQRVPAAAPDVVIMDIHLPDGSGIFCTARIKRELPDTQIVMFTVHDDIDQIVRALEAGAAGYLLKSTPSVEIVAAIRDVRNHGAPMTREVAHKLIESFHRKAPSPDTAEPLTAREEEILDLLSEGLLSKEIGERLQIKLDTVSTHLKSIYRKLHVRSRAEAVIKYRR